MDNVYLIYGDEEFLIDKEIKNIINKFNSSIENVARYNLDESNVREAIEDACTISMFETNKIVICEKCNFLTGENKKEVNHDIDSLIKYITNVTIVNDDPEFQKYMSEEEDKKKIQNSLLSEAKEEGISQEKVSIAKNMLNKNMPLEDILDITGLSIEEINELRKN